MAMARSGIFLRSGIFHAHPLEATVNALLQEGKARLISKPRLVALSGKQASFLVGGEIPVLNTTTNTTGTTQTTKHHLLAIRCQCNSHTHYP